ncbi:MAG TPA: murein L,D-transpeptidase catalytic domain family protein [Steroidobacteraceae bacterium]|nr:murein L,D-transpeptidase catalytic domain family protein [Steroidobacteraceae bacterium]
MRRRFFTLFAILGLTAAPLAAKAGAAETDLVRSVMQQTTKLQPAVLERALAAYRCAMREQLVERPGLLTLIDYAKPSTEPRLWVLDLDRGRVLYEELVAHGRNTGELFATAFSNVPESKQSSIGVFRTGATYFGKHGLSLRLDGLEPGVNDKARDRAIVMHGADYVSERFVERQGRLGRSWGCPAVRREIARPLINLLSGGSLIFAHYPDSNWLANSEFLNGCGASRVAQNDERRPAG